MQVSAPPAGLPRNARKARLTRAIAFVV